MPTRATLRFTDVGSYFGGSYWKVHQLARFELWRVDRRGREVRRVRVGPKLNYCLRGCFAFVMRVDPRHLLYESNERDNSARRLIRLPYPDQPGC